MRKTSIILIVLLFLGQVSALSGNIRENGCQKNENAAFSMYSKTGGNIAKPGYYKYDLCLTELKDIQIREGCNQGENSMISMISKTDSHASTYTAYKWDVCIDRANTLVKQSCDNSVASLESKDDSHIAKPNYFKWQLCPKFLDPENVTLELDGVSGSIYADDNSISTGESLNPPVEYPYIVSDQPAGLVGFGEFVSLSYPSSSKVSMTQTAGSSFLLPFTQGGYQEVEDEQEEINSGEFLNLLEPSFGFTIPESPTVRISYDFERNVKGFNDTQQGFIELALRNRFTDSNKTRLLIRPP